MRRWIFPLLIPLTLGGCTDGPEATGLFHGLPVERINDTEVLALGERVYVEHCASCHLEGASGEPQWRKLGEDGRFPPPPLNGDGHSWHHPSMVLKRVIHDGGPMGRSNMPPWGDKLSDEEIEAVIAWFQSLWPQQAFEAWARMETEMRERDAELGMDISAR